MTITVSPAFTTYVGHLIRLFEMIRLNTDDTPEADALRDAMYDIDKDREFNDTEHELAQRLSGDLYMLQGESMYIQTTDAERTLLALELRECLVQSQWFEVIRILHSDLGFTEEHIAFIRSLAWSPYDRRVSDLFFAHHERLREQRYRAETASYGAS